MFEWDIDWKTRRGHSTAVTVNTPTPHGITVWMCVMVQRLDTITISEFKTTDVSYTVSPSPGLGWPCYIFYHLCLFLQLTVKSLHSWKQYNTRKKINKIKRRRKDRTSVQWTSTHTFSIKCQKSAETCESLHLFTLPHRVFFGVKFLKNKTQVQASNPTLDMH